MNKSLIIAGVAAIVALAAIGFAFAVTGDDDEPSVVNPLQPTATVDASPSPDDSVSATPGPPSSPDDTVSATPGGPPGPGPTAVPPLSPDRRAVPAPIDGLEILVLESFPPQYLLNVQAGLPSGCAQQYKHEAEREGNVITVTVLNSLPTATDMACTAIYGMYELNINLGSDFEPGETYTVLVNDKETSFTAQ